MIHIGVITNPNSRKNKGRHGRAAALQSIVGDVGIVHETPTLESVKPILRDFLRRRAMYWVADGGDGALHWMLRLGIEVLQEPEFSGGGFSLPMALPTRGGTIDFVAKNVGIEGNAESLLAGLRRSIELGQHVELVEVDSMLIRGIEVNGEEREFCTYGFAVAAGGVGQRFFSKYYEEADPSPATILKVIGKTLASMPVAFSPLGSMPGGEALSAYARELFAPTQARITLDGMELPDTAYRGIHVASMSINLGNVFRLFGRADEKGLMHAIIGAVSPMTVVRNIPRMHLGRQLKGTNIIDRPCRELTIEAVGDELLAPVIDGELYENVKSVSFTLGPRVRIAKVTGRPEAS